MKLRQALPLPRLSNFTRIFNRHTSPTPSSPRSSPLLSESGEPIVLELRHGATPLPGNPEVVTIWLQISFVSSKALLPHADSPPCASLQWEVATDRSFRQVITFGLYSIAVSSVEKQTRIRVDRLIPESIYFYRFRIGNFISRIGTIETSISPSPTDLPMRQKSF